MIAIVLYEDTWGETRSDFAPHQLVLQCVADRVPHRTLWELRGQIVAIPKRGDAKLLRALHQEMSRIAPRGQLVFALLDEDRIRKLLGLPQAATEQDITRAIRAPENVQILLLVRNMEDVVRAVAACRGDIDAALVEQATTQKKLRARDEVLGKATYGPIAVRDCVLGRIGALQALVERLVELVH